jgi:hypothetical protein
VVFSHEGSVVILSFFLSFANVSKSRQNEYIKLRLKLDIETLGHPRG